MKYHGAALVAATALVAVACDRDTGPTDPNLAPVAYVRYVHAVVDTGATDWRPIDRLEDSPPGIAVAFRAFTSYQAMGVGTRHLRIFPTTTNIHQTSAYLIDTTITFAADTYYTLVHVGSARGGTDRLLLIEDDNSAPPAGQIRLRVLHAGVGIGNVDVFAFRGTATTARPATPTIPNVAFGATASANIPADTTGDLQVVFQARASTDSAHVAAPAGAAPTRTFDGEAGSEIAGSVLTAIVVGRAVTGSTAGNFPTPGIIILRDRRPPRPSS